jgi:hypothetical protein
VLLNRLAPAQVHGYWDWDWADGILKVTGITKANTTWLARSPSPPTPSNVEVSTAGPAGVGKHNARFVGLNLLSELDQVGEFFISKAGMLSYMPAGPPGGWSSPPVVSRNVSCINATGTSHVTIKGLTVAHCKGYGIEVGGTAQLFV